MHYNVQVSSSESSDSHRSARSVETNYIRADGICTIAFIIRENKEHRRLGYSIPPPLGDLVRAIEIWLLTFSDVLVMLVKSLAFLYQRSAVSLHQYPYPGAVGRLVLCFAFVLIQPSKW